MAEQIELRTFTFIDVLQPQLASFIATVARGFLPLEHEAALFVEIAPDLQINVITDLVLKRTSVIPGMQNLPDPSITTSASDRPWPSPWPAGNTAAMRWPSITTSRTSLAFKA